MTDLVIELEKDINLLIGIPEIVDLTNSTVTFSDRTFTQKLRIL